MKKRKNSHRLQKKLQSIEKEIVAIEEKEQAHTAQYNDLKRAIEEDSHESREAEREVFRIVGEQREAENELSRIQSEITVLDRDRMEFKRELQEAVALIGSGAAQYFTFEITVDGNVLTNKNIADESRQTQRDRRRELEKKKIRLEELGGANQDIEKEYTEVVERDEFLVHEITDLEASAVKLDALIAELVAQLDEQFVAGIDKIDVEFSRFFYPYVWWR